MMKTWSIGGGAAAVGTGATGAGVTGAAELKGAVEPAAVLAPPEPPLFVHPADNATTPTARAAPANRLILLLERGSHGQVSCQGAQMQEMRPCKELDLF